MFAKQPQGLYRLIIAHINYIESDAFKNTNFANQNNKNSTKCKVYEGRKKLFLYFA